MKAMFNFRSTANITKISGTTVVHVHLKYKFYIVHALLTRVLFTRSSIMGWVRITNKRRNLIVPIG